MRKFFKKVEYTVQRILFVISYLAFFVCGILSCFWSRNKFNIAGLLCVCSLVVLVASIIWIVNTKED